MAKEAQTLLDFRTRLLYAWELLVLTILSPIFLQQRPLSSGRTIFSTSSRQPLRDILSDFFPGKPIWRPESDMPDQTGRVAIVTGGNSGIGYETVRGLMRKGARVYMASRPHQRTKEAIAMLREEGSAWPGEVKLLSCDLSDMDSVQSAADEFGRCETALHMLVCNAGVSNPPSGQKTAQGYDLTLGTNVLGHHQLIQDLLPILRNTAKQPGVPKNGVRVCIVSSWCHNMHQPSGFDQRDPEWQNGITMSIIPGRQLIIRPHGPGMELIKYGHSKFLNVLQAKKLHRMHSPEGIVFTSCDPGNNATELLRNRDSLSNFVFNYILVPLMLFHPSYGAISQLWACTAPEAGILGGQYLAPWARLSFAATPTEDHRTQDNLHEWCEKQLHKHGYQ